MLIHKNIPFTHDHDHLQEQLGHWLRICSPLKLKNLRVYALFLLSKILAADLRMLQNAPPPFFSFRRLYSGEDRKL